MSTFVCTKYSAKPGMLDKVVEFVRTTVVQAAGLQGAQQLQLAVNQEDAELMVSSYWDNRHHAEIFRDTLYDAIDDDVDYCLTAMPDRAIYEVL